MDPVEIEARRLLRTWLHARPDVSELGEPRGAIHLACGQEASERA